MYSIEIGIRRLVIFDDGFFDALKFLRFVISLPMDNFKINKKKYFNKSLHHLSLIERFRWNIDGSAIYRMVINFLSLPEGRASVSDAKNVGARWSELEF